MTSTASPLVGKSLQASLTMKDLQKSISFYTDVLGFTVDRKIERDGKLRGVAISAGEVRLNINQDDGAKGWERVKAQGLSLQIVTVQSIDEIAARIKKSGGHLELEPKDMPWGSRIIRIKDLDGFLWTISGPLAGK